MHNPLTELTIDELRRRRSVKWRRYAPPVLPLFIAEMDTPLAAPIEAALRHSIEGGDVGYAHPGRLAEAFAGFAERRFGWTPDPARMSLLPDVMQGVAAVLRLVGAPGDGVVVNPPVYPPFFAFIEAAGRRPVSSPLARSAGGGYRLDLDALDRDLARPDVTAYLLCNPHNPTGLVHSRDELMAVGELTDRHGVQLLVDEIHAPLTYPGVTHIPIATVAAAGAQAAVAFVSASKAWNLPGLKAALAVAGGDAGWSLLSRLPEQLAYGSGLLGVVAGEAAFDAGEEWLSALLAGLDENRKLLATLLAEHLPLVGFRPPDATYLAWLDLRRLELGADPAAALLERAAVALHPGPAFGDGGPGYARLTLATSPAILAEVVERMAAALDP